MKSSDLARVFRQSGYDISALMRELLTSNAFYASENRAALIKSPVELMVGTMKLFDIEFKNLRPVAVASAFLGQNVFSPPNVKGWPGGKAWINSTTLLARKQTLSRLFRAEEMPEEPIAQVTGKRERRLMKATRDSFDYQRFAAGHTKDDIVRVVLPQAPEERPQGEGVDFVRALVLDPVYQLK